MSIVVLEFEKMPVAIMGPCVLHFLGYNFWGLKQGFSLLHGRAGPVSLCASFLYDDLSNSWPT